MENVCMPFVLTRRYCILCIRYYFHLSEYIANSVTCEINTKFSMMKYLCKLFVSTKIYNKILNWPPEWTWIMKKPTHTIIHSMYLRLPECLCPHTANCPAWWCAAFRYFSFSAVIKTHINYSTFLVGVYSLTRRLWLAPCGRRRASCWLLSPGGHFAPDGRAPTRPNRPPRTGRRSLRQSTVQCWRKGHVEWKPE